MSSINSVGMNLEKKCGQIKNYWPVENRVKIGQIDPGTRIGRRSARWRRDSGSENFQDQVPQPGETRLYAW